MLTSQRKSLLLDRLARDGRLVASDLAAELGLSEDTLRRDLRDLAAAGLLLRVHGGALPLSPTHQPFARRQAMSTPEKERLARAGAGLIRQGMVVMVDGGTTHQTMAALLPAALPFTVVTHSPAFAAAMEPYPQIEVQLVGGRLFRHSMVASGAAAQETLGRMRADLCFLGVTGLHPATGLTTGDAEEAAIKATMIRQSAETVVLATSDKLGASSPWSIAPLDALSVLVSCGARPGWLPEGARHLAA